MTKLSQWMITRSKGWLVLLAIVVFVLFMIFVLPSQSDKADEYARGSGSPDTSFFYSPERLFEMAEVYGEEGRNAYVRARFSFDLIFPLAYVFFLGTTISWLLNNNLATESRWRQLNLFPVLGGIFDLLENTSTSLVMIGYPERRLLIAQMAAIFTLVKWIFVGGSFVILMVIMGIWVVRKLRAGR
jgi:hypothetical protein